MSKTCRNKMKGHAKKETNKRKRPNPKARMEARQNKKENTMSLTIKIGGRTDIRGREENQDSLILDLLQGPMEEDGTCSAVITAKDGELHFVAVADGVGGAEHGKLASVGALKKIRSAFQEACENGSFDTLEELAALLMDEANQKVNSLCRAMRTQMGTTLSILFWEGRHFLIANVGDSPVYLFRHGSLSLMSIPHTLGYMLEKEGRQIEPGSDNCLINFIGHPILSGAEMMDVAEGEFEEGDRILLSSDGLTKEISDELLERIIRENQFSDLLDHFWDELNHKGIRKDSDNCTVILLEAKNG